MNQKVVVIFVGTGENPNDLQVDIDKYLNEGWEIKQISTAYFNRPGHGMSIAVTLLLGK